MKPGPKADRVDNLRRAAVDYAAAVELGDDLVGPWDLLRKAAIRYRDEPKFKGRPRNEDRD